jgi:hypothetical protein
MPSPMPPPVPSRISLERGGGGVQGGFVNPTFVFSSPFPQATLPTVYGERDGCEWSLMRQDQQVPYEEVVGILHQVLEQLQALLADVDVTAHQL